MKALFNNFSVDSDIKLEISKIDKVMCTKMSLMEFEKLTHHEDPYEVHHHSQDHTTFDTFFFSKFVVPLDALDQQFYVRLETEIIVERLCTS